jgi:hypothetical protein
MSLGNPLGPQIIARSVASGESMIRLTTRLFGSPAAGGQNHAPIKLRATINGQIGANLNDMPAGTKAAVSHFRLDPRGDRLRNRGSSPRAAGRSRPPYKAPGKSRKGSLAYSPSGRRHCWAGTPIFPVTIDICERLAARICSLN